MEEIQTLLKIFFKKKKKKKKKTKCIPTEMIYLEKEGRKEGRKEGKKEDRKGFPYY